MDVVVLTAWCDRFHRFRQAIVTATVDRQPAQCLRILGFAIGASVLLGVLSGVAWAFLAPAEQFLVVEPGLGSALTGESLHRFDSLALLVCCTLVMGIVVPVAFWTWTRVRGPVLYLGLLVGAFLGSAAMLGVGILVAGLVHPRIDDPAAGSVVALAPGMESPLVLLVQPLVASLVVLLLAAMNPHDNLRFTPESDGDPEDGFDLGADARVQAPSAERT